MEKPSQSHQQQNGGAPRPPALSKEPVLIVGIPALGDSSDQHSRSTRKFVVLKLLGHGSFGSVTLCDYQVEGMAFQPSAMQLGKSRPEWKNRRLVAIKRMRRPFNGGWDECQNIQELKSLRALSHPNIIRLHDFFMTEEGGELHFVMEAMEGNLLQLLDSRKGRVLAGGLVASIFTQVVSGLDCIHGQGWLHRDLKPDNLLITTTGLHDYNPLTASATTKTDVVVIVKIADFGLACETKDRKALHTPYVSTRWYRAPEIVLHARDYSNPVDMWALGTIMVEVLTLRPLFPGKGELDQIMRICDVLGNPSDEHGVDRWGKPIGGGAWKRGISMAASIGFSFPELRPRDLASYFDATVPPTLIECIKGMLRYDPERRFTSHQVLRSAYITETARMCNAPRTLSSLPTPRPRHPQPTPIVVAQPDAMDISSPPISPVSPGTTSKPTLATKPAFKKYLGGMFGSEKEPLDEAVRARKKEAARIQQEAEVQRHALMAKTLKDQSRAVVQNKARIEVSVPRSLAVDMRVAANGIKVRETASASPREALAASPLQRRERIVESNAIAGPSTAPVPPPIEFLSHCHNDHTDDHSMFSEEEDRMSFMSSDTMDSDLTSISSGFSVAMASTSSLATTVGGRTEDMHLATEFSKRASFGSPSPDDVVMLPPINPMWAVPEPDRSGTPTGKHITRLPPFSHLAAVAGRARPYSPITFTKDPEPEDWE